MTPGFELRAVVPEDLPDLLRMMRDFAEFERLSQYFTTTEAKLGDALFGAAPVLGGVLAVAGGRAVGFALWAFRYRTFQAMRTLFVEDVYVEAAQRGSGIGYALFRYMAQIGRAQGCDRMEWRVLDWNRSAIDFYHRLGARPPRGWIAQQLDGEAFDSLAQ